MNLTRADLAALRPGRADMASWRHTRFWRSLSLIERLETYYEPEPNSGCWIWLGHRDRKGYGAYKQSTAHRVAYRAYVGPVDPALTIDHLCKNKSCVNPQHLEQTTNHENQRRSDRATQTLCQRGHPLERVPGQRVCRVCWNASRRLSKRHQRRARVAGVLLEAV